MRSESGLTLIELMIYSMLSIVVLIIVGGFLVNSLRTEDMVLDSTEASTAGQLVADSVGRGVRNASAIEQTEPWTDAVLLTARTTSSAADWVCRAWSYYDGEIRTRTSAGAIPTPTEADLEGWTLLSEGISPVAGAPVFELSDRRVDITFESNTGTGKPVLFSTSALSRQPVPATGVESSPCF